MRFPRSLSPESFLAGYWQKKPLFMPAGTAPSLPQLEADELAWLATLADVESRLVFSERKDERTTYRLENGPFSDAELNALPGSDWTLLVQDVDKHLPDFRAYFELAEFIPSWRIDDLMVSCAAPGGSVGPHRDRYDVFLCQGEGHRNWSVGSTGAVAPDDAAAGLSLLQPFAANVTHRAGSGDVLYLPPGVPHWGVAEDFCVTYSLGMRAPNKAELQAGLARVISSHKSCAWNDDDADIFYGDADLTVEESGDGSLSIRTLRRVREQQLLPAELSDDALARVFGSVVTDPKAWLAPDEVAADRLLQFLGHVTDLPVHGMARIAWYGVDGGTQAFANGIAHKMPADALGLLREICETRIASRASIERLLPHTGGRKFIAWLLSRGVFDLDLSRE